MGVRYEPELRTLDGEAGRRIGSTDVLVDGVARAAMPALHVVAAGRGLRARSHSMSAAVSRWAASSIDRTAAEPGSPNRNGSADPVAP